MASTGASLTAVTLIVRVLAMLVLAPLLSVPPLSCTSKPMRAYPLPMAFAAGA